MTGQSTHDVEIGAATVTKRYVSWERGEAEREWTVLELLAEHAPGLAPRPLHRREEDGRPVIVMSRVPGRPLGEQQLDAATLDALVASLHRLHAVPLDAVRATGIGERIEGPSAAIGVMAARLAAAPDPVDAGDPALVARALTRAREVLADPGLLPGAGLEVLARGDGNLANLLWDGTICRLVDVEDSGLSELAYEVADLVEHVSARLPRLLDVEALLDRLDLPPGQRDRVHGWRLIWAAFWLDLLLPGHRGAHRNPPGSLEDQARHLLALAG